MNKLINHIKRNKSLFLTSLYLGLTGFGGLASIDLIKREFVTKKKMITPQKFLNTLSLSQILPGSNIINLISYFNYLQAGLVGAIIGTLVYILPTFMLTTVFAAIYFRYSQIPIVANILKGLNILLVALLANFLFSIGKSAYFRKRGIDYRNFIISVLSFFLYFFSNISLIPLMVISGILGIVLYAFTGFFNDKMNDYEIVKGVLFKHKTAWLALIVGILLFSLSIYYLSAPLWLLFSSFFKIGSLAFGGGIAAIPLIEDTFVKNLHWFSSTQFWDGMAIGQITPGPIMIASAFFGYKVAGIMGAAVATIGMCIPSVVLIILVGKVHERVRHLVIVRSITRGFLAGFIGILAGLIITQMKRSLVSWQAVLLAVICLLSLFKLKNGLLVSILISLTYALLLV